ncbi:hypothetical protein M413DRAFT_11042 [Hebeloma cylindrosporum]|uniref:Uncharacterized protein n=1 Tax=Hebeloma cylindrosporum TaxID=76867 RepID=A0A0C3BY24_HEBCY|nr:hypothetical protein M413DRAFT_11042 [Hebeloma cylindrosporum h7]
MAVKRRGGGDTALPTVELLPLAHSHCRAQYEAARFYRRLRCAHTNAHSLWQRPVRSSAIPTAAIVIPHDGTIHQSFRRHLSTGAVVQGKEGQLGTSVVLFSCQPTQYVSTIEAFEDRHWEGILDVLGKPRNMTRREVGAEEN